MYLIIEIRTHSLTLINSTWKLKIAILHAKRQDFCVIILHFVVLVFICGFLCSPFSTSSTPSSSLSLQYNILVETMKQWPKLVYFFCGCEVRDGFASCFVQFPLHEHMKCFVVIYKAHISIFTFLTFDSIRWLFRAPLFSLLLLLYIIRSNKHFRTKM